MERFFSHNENHHVDSVQEVYLFDYIHTNFTALTCRIEIADILIVSSRPVI